MHADRRLAAPESQYSDGKAVCLSSRSGALISHTSGLAPGFVQGNLVILPAILAREFLRF